MNCFTVHCYVAAVQWWQRALLPTEQYSIELHTLSHLRYKFDIDSGVHINILFLVAVDVLKSLLFAASTPYVQIDLQSGELEGYDAIFLSPHKFVGGPGTPGILLMSKSLYYLKSSAPSTCGGGTVSFVNGFNEHDTLYYNSIEEREDAGTPPIVQKIRAALAFWSKEYMGNHLIETQENLWIHRALKRLLPNPNIHVLGNTSVKRQPILSFFIYTTSFDQEKEGRDHSGYLERKSNNEG
ncbi:hypothetical protein FRX31_010424 [Thalictrum thalictroides]|uniref:Aminotransferase class V domain-containing protein n=1 Tax=Thalictrum thalictroides TaxID=46969 RepID=A0A7J6WRJ7_THATH|nr:hypothetical protein FRX31_010424 [Thalictrum thalictroides]